jgi:hypothetical protein
MARIVFGLSFQREAQALPPQRHCDIAENDSLIPFAALKIHDWIRSRGSGHK